MGSAFAQLHHLVSQKLIGHEVVDDKNPVALESAKDFRQSLRREVHGLVNKNGGQS